MLVGLSTGAGGLVAGTGAYGFLYERHRLQVVRETLPVSGLPEGFDGLRVGLMTDVHHSQFVSRENVEAAVDLLMAEQPDLIILGGDYVSYADRAYMTPCAEALSRLHAPHGVFAALGNHDDERDMPAELARRGVTMLMDQRTWIEVNHDRLAIAGLRYWTRRASDIAAVLNGVEVPTLLIAHDPRRLSEAAALDVGLVLSGHTHGGQVVVPGLGAVAARKFPVVAGRATRENTTIFVSRGVGTVIVPYRLNCPPDVSVLTLERKSRI